MYIYVVAMEATERLAFYSLAANLATYLVSEMQEPLPKAVKIISNWIGAAYLLGIPGGFIADAYLGRFYTIALHSVFYILVRKNQTIIHRIHGFGDSGIMISFIEKQKICGYAARCINLNPFYRIHGFDSGIVISYQKTTDL